MKIINKLRSKFAVAFISLVTLLSPMGVAGIASAAQATGTAPYGPYPFTVGSRTGNPAGQWYLTFNGQYPAVSQVCVTFGFSGNLLDPGEKLNVSVAGAPVSQVLTNTGSTSLNSGTVCFTDTDSLNRFKDGNDVIRVTPVVGSVTFTSVTGQLTFSSLT